MAKKTTKKAIVKKAIAKKLVVKKIIAKQLAVEKDLPRREAVSSDLCRTKIKVIGIGGGGCSIISEIANDLKRAEFVAANTDFYALKELPANIKRFHFGQDLTHGLGTGMQPEVGAEAAQMEKDKIKKMMEGYDFCILVASLGGGTGSGATPIFAKLSRELKNITYGIFTMPFVFEGEKKNQIARESLEQIRPYLNAFTIIPNERIFQVVNKDTPLKQALTIVNKNLAQSLEGLIEMIYSPGLVNIDFADFKTVLEKRGRLTYLNTIEVQGEGRAEEAVKKITANLLYPYDIKGAKGVLFNVSGGKGLALRELSKISESISQAVSSDAKIIFGTSQNEKLKEKIKITLLASGCSFPRLAGEDDGQKKKPKKLRLKKKVVKEPVKEELPPAPAVKKKSPKPKTKKNVTSLVVAKPNNLVVEPSKKEEPEAEKPREIKIPVNKPENLPVNLTPNKSVLVEKTDLKRRNALQIKKAAEEAEKEILDQEVKWDTPAFLRRKGETNK
ncbi:MAG: cell division protein FtsZ [bacterium]